MKTNNSPYPAGYQRKSYVAPHEIYFWTATIWKWHHLLQNDSLKKIVLDSLAHLSSKGLVDIYAFVIMPNHLHLIWRANAKNGKEPAPASFLKYTAHWFKKYLINTPGNELGKYRVRASDRSYCFWQRDSLAIRLYTKAVAIQKLNYIHANPLAGKWHLADDPCAYRFSSASYYAGLGTEYKWLKNLYEEF